MSSPYASRTCAPRVFLCARFDSSSSPAHPFPCFFPSLALPLFPLGGCKNPFCLRRRSLALVFVRLVQPSSAHNGMSVGLRRRRTESCLIDRFAHFLARSPAAPCKQARTFISAQSSPASVVVKPNFLFNPCSPRYSKKCRIPVIPNLNQ